MQFTVKSVPATRQRAACTIVGVFESRRMSSSAAALDRVSRGYIVNILKRGDMKAAPGQTLMLYNVPRAPGERVLLVGCGKEKELDASRYRKAVTGMTAALRDSGVRDAVCYLPEVEVRERDLAWKLRQAVESVSEGLYRFDQLKSKKEDVQTRFSRLQLNVPDPSQVAEGRAAVRVGEAVAGGVALARHLGDLPGNICTPSFLADEARRLARGYRGKISVKVLDEKQIAALKMGALLAVARGSREPPRFIVLSWNGGSKGEKPQVLVGKGITFDSGGISIKPGATMDEMKYDMCGAASVLGTMSAVAAMDLPLNVIGVIPSCENLPDGNAVKPGDIATSMSGQTIEILNTDAEGRLILSDALTYCERFEPQAVVDIATLTGACVIALGKHASGLLGNNAALIDALRAAGNSSGDRVWELPLWEEYQDQLKSSFADMTNVGGREAGTITAACFLSRYTKKYPWAHLDIAGVAWRTGTEKGATGRPVPLLTQYLIDQARGEG
jgi:leucyl aminopeptidase